MTISNGVADAIEEAVTAAYEAEDYLLADGNRDKAKVRSHMLEVLKHRKVLSRGERKDKAISRGAMVAAVFPSLAGPDSWSDEDDPALAEAVWGKINSILWSEARTAATSPLQVLVGITMGNGYVMCRTKVGAPDPVDAVYITDDVTCIELDYVQPEHASLERKLRSHVANVEMLTLRHPDQRWLSGFDKKLKLLTASGHAQLSLALEAATTGPGEDDDANNEDDSED